jgi:hypothetical protein
MSESNEDRLARKKRERAEYLKQEREDAALAKKLDSDPEFAKSFDESFVRGFTSAEDELLDKFAKDKGYSRSETEAMKRTVARARKTAKGGFFTAPDPAEAEKILMSNRGIREMRKSKEDKSCFIAGLLMLAFFGSTISAALYGAAEIVSALTH